MSGAAQEVSGWGRYPRRTTRLVSVRDEDAVAPLHRSGTGLVARGNGRAYGDAAIGADTTLDLRGLDRMVAFDPGTGHLTVEAGVLLADIIDAFLPRGFFPAVVPGTRTVTVGGMIAADVHGKNHHGAGGFGAHLRDLTLALPDGTVRSCGPGSELFAATVGGMGLTGTILRATLRLRRVETGWIRRSTVAAADLDAAMAALEAAHDTTYAVAWIDGLARGAARGRALVYRGEHATRADLAALSPGAPLQPPAGRGALAVPFDLPALTLNRVTVGAFNALYYGRGRAGAGRDGLVGWAPYFFPLDGIRDWNRIYGARGFLQHQCVIPKARSRDTLGAILERVSHAAPSFLAVLKLLGGGGGLLSFPIRGYTLTLDFPATPANLALLDDLDAIVRDAGGRIYLAKDARQSRDTFEAGYGDAAARFRALRRAIDGEGRIASVLSRRLGL
ncbi:FAD-binding oxidoreductase [Methylobacterium gossipiicola]|uniref:FAD/FMN-containing dehydrogenase n=1 Tax=Methylobacterium gossipiicola TaxID=582675 RepID=A0A1I2XN65_9HYPH|nr:FAD-binding oxidoreductase [Methylobacterium gossipiicola]SFH14489.1 FAD/FMN-containing dehydrogenase [Methylobacterium gossipiicola]